LHPVGSPLRIGSSNRFDGRDTNRACQGCEALRSPHANDTQVYEPIGFFVVLNDL
jgi:hypothetical protein